MSRSFTGCKRCKARRQKCDEQRPECSRCRTAGAPCQYTMQLQWGGRTFSRSRFGACEGMQRLEYSPGEFIYTTGSESGSPALPVSIGRTVNPFSSLTTEQQSLLRHFITDASQITACHSGMREEICRMLVPMALQTPSLLYATTALSAIHLQALSNQSASVKDAPEIARLMALSLEHFRRELQDPSSSASADADALLATARTLCLAEIHSGALHPHTWRVHIEGAKALMASSGSSKNKTRTGHSPPDAFRRYLDRWYRAIVALTALTGNGPPIEQTEVDSNASDPSSPDYLDDYWGFSVHLAEIFREIGAAAWRRQQKLNNNDENESSADSLERSLRRLMDADPPTFYPGVQEGLSEQCIREFALCNEAFQHSALIQIHRRLHDTPDPSRSEAVQASVQRILACTVQITPSSGLSPWVMLTTPLFVAGCEARAEDRALVRQLLGALHDTIRVPNVLQSLNFLEQYWAEQLEGESWSQFLDTTSSGLNGTPGHIRLASEPFLLSPRILPPPPPSASHRRAQTMALQPQVNRPPPLHLESTVNRSISGSSTDSKHPKTPGNRITSFFGWKTTTSPGADSSSTEVSDDIVHTPFPSYPFPPPPPRMSAASVDLVGKMNPPSRNPSLGGAAALDPMLTAKTAELENELREISSELAGSIRREMELEDLVERLQSEMPLELNHRRTSDYFSDEGTSSIRYASDAGRSVDDIDKIKRSAEQERAQLKVDLSQKWQEERSRRAACESHVKILEAQVQQLRRERVDTSDLASKNKEMEIALEDTRRKLIEERQIKDNFEDLLTAMRVELQQLRDERDHLRDYQMQTPATPQVDPAEIERLMGEIAALKIENASLAQLQTSRFASIAEENGGTAAARRSSGFQGLSRSNSLVRGPPRSSNSGLSRSNSVSNKDRNESRESLADRMKDVEAQRDALHQALRSLLHRQSYQSRENEKHMRVLELELAQARQQAAASGPPRKLGYEREVFTLREEINHLRQRAEDALDQKWQCEKGLAGLKMDLDRAKQETGSLRTLLQEHDISVPEELVTAATTTTTTTTTTSDEDLAEVQLTTSSLEDAYRQLQADREYAEAHSPSVEQATEAASRTDLLADHVRRQLATNRSLRGRLADAIGKGEKEQQVSAERINGLQQRLKGLEDMLMVAQQHSEDQMSRHEDEIRSLKENHTVQLHRMKNGIRSPVALSPKPPNTPWGARSPRLDRTTSGEAMPLTQAVQTEELERRVKELERALRDADLEMGEVIGRMNRAQIEVAELQSDRDEALRETRRLQAEIQTERQAFQAMWAA
ncbi:hypothetical protein ASPZODRAFT_149192 [Penicilliopsis zonata CBS 506.65]|uniref:Zn(2)-C6 fungal-type domain-containing protein n=1 Tax=Penicilliopsis zonata CBS 506.65 TaxID=1073090 RepID=A0A1L9SR48_9EURO|nr:hypothetical protein ASPZODRAFT_149192 [Penicilliopsis zonata CBS 506.65]OJJ49700.1 hypothetical protein ASPZODRAFT_149192 [Penicilliopsis zonata CBS 506.65]